LPRVVFFMGMILGIICGILIAILIVLVEVYFILRNKSPIEQIGNIIKHTLPQKATIIKPPNASQDALDTIFKINDDLGIDTKLDEYL
jgi:MFS superfamily sulfate permease-like transporter